MTSAPSNDPLDQTATEFLHEPTRPPRRGTAGEVIFSEEWRRLMASPPQRLVDFSSEDANHLTHDILHDLPVRATQRHATIMASLVCWFGTNCGRAFIHEARRAAEADTHVERAWLGAWAWENVRQSGINGGVRILEAVMAPTWPGPLPELSVEDYEVADCLVRWLATHGRAFLGRCESRLMDQLEGEHRARTLAWRQQLAAAGL